MCFFDAQPVTVACTTYQLVLCKGSKAPNWPRGNRAVQIQRRFAFPSPLWVIFEPGCLPEAPQPLKASRLGSPSTPVAIGGRSRAEPWPSVTSLAWVFNSQPVGKRLSRGGRKGPLQLTLRCSKARGVLPTECGTGRCQLGPAAVRPGPTGAHTVTSRSIARQPANTSFVGTATASGGQQWRLQCPPLGKGQSPIHCVPLRPPGLHRARDRQRERLLLNTEVPFSYHGPASTPLL